ncbi:MAG TPA: DUF4215 domain-containing protein [Polyangiaceae bacterium]|jgi:hypothetical protein
MRFPVRPAAAMAAALALLPACEKDVVLPDLETAPVCGNGILEVGEQCDVQSPGCVQCMVVPGYTCDSKSCIELCEDGLVGTNGVCDHRDSACDMTGYWAARETDYTRDEVLSAIQTSSNWMLYRFSQSGDTFQVEEALECGTHVTGSATVDGTAGALRGELYLNRMDPQGPHGARHGTSKAQGSGCAVSLDRWYAVFGADDTFLPADFGTGAALSTLPALPKEADPINGTDSPAGATDPDGDGIPGAAYSISGIANGIRNAAQRYWKEYATVTGSEVPTAAISIVVPGTYDLDVSVLRVTQCDPGCSLLAAGAHPANTPGRVTMQFIGKTYGTPHVSQIVAGVPGQDPNADVTTCANLQLLLPHDPTAPTTP